MNNRPIGIFDSGYGGLTVLREVHKLMPNESIIYLGDSKNAPYSQYSKDECIEKARKCAEFLISQDCKALIVACNLMSGIALPVLKEKLKVPIIGVIDSGVDTIESNLQYENKNIGIIGSPVLMNSSIYQNAIKSKLPKLNVWGVGTAELVPLVESGKLKEVETEEIIRSYEKEFPEKLDMLVLGCTHYPLLSEVIQHVFGEDVLLIDPAEAVSKKIREILVSVDKLCMNNNNGTQTYYTSGNTETFKRFMLEVLNIKSDNVFQVVL